MIPWRHPCERRDPQPPALAFGFNCQTASGCAFAFPRRDAPELCADFHPLKEEGAGKAGCALHPRSRVQNAQGKNAHEHTGSAEASGFPCAVVYGLFRALPGEPSSFATVACRIASTSLAPASGARTTRLRRPRQQRSSLAAISSTAPHRASVTTATRPSFG